MSNLITCARCSGVKEPGDESCQTHSNRKVNFICAADGCNTHVPGEGRYCLEHLYTLGQTIKIEVAPPWHEAYHKILDQCKELIDERGKDYNQGSVDMPDYFPFGDKSYFQMLWIKILRLQSLIESEGSDSAKMDSIIDLINYAAFYGIYLQRD